MTAACSSPAVICSQENSSCWGNGDGIHSGREKSWGSAWHISLKKLKASFPENWGGIWEVDLLSSSCFQTAKSGGDNTAWFCLFACQTGKLTSGGCARILA